MDYLKKICHDHLQQDDMMNSMSILGLLQQADYGFSMHGMHISKHNHSDIKDFANIMINNHNQSEQARYKKVKFDDDFIQYAHIKEQTK